LDARGALSGYVAIDGQCRGTDIIILDVMMKPMDGGTLLHIKLKRQEMSRLHANRESLTIKDVLKYGDRLTIA
jgi:CheY-like chemotaxis protein